MAEISPIEHGVMWIGAYEFQHCLDVPWRVALNECIELAKEFGGTDGHKYVNGVLNGLAAAAARGRGRSRPPERQSPPMKISQRAPERIEPFYVMEVAKAASAMAREVAHTDAPMIFLNIGEPDFTAPPLVQEAADQRHPRRPHAVHRRPPACRRCASASAAGTRSASAWTCPPAASSSPPAPRPRCSWPAWR